MIIVSWNIQWGRGVDGRVDLGRIVEHARRFADFDVLCLQEVAAGFADLPGSDGSDQFAEFSRRLPDFHAIEGVATDWAAKGGRARRRFGNMILSRLPVAPVLRHLLPWPADPAVPSMQRCMVEASVHSEFGPVRVMTTHLEYYSALQRRAQIECLRQLNAEACEQSRRGRAGRPGDGPFDAVARAAPGVIVGDFNCEPSAPEIAALQDSVEFGIPRLCDAWTLVHPGRAHEPTLGLFDKQQWPGPAKTYDFAFVTEDLAARVRRLEIDPSSDASDHQALVIELR